MKVLILFALFSLVLGGSIPEYDNEFEPAYFDDDKRTPEPTNEPTQPSTHSPGGERSLKDKIYALEKLMKIVIKNVHPDDKGFVRHEDIEEPGGKIIDLVIKAIKPIKTIAHLVMEDVKECNIKLEKAFKERSSKHAIELQAGQCFFVIHRPFVVLVKQAFDKGLFDKFENKDGKRDKRGIVELAKTLKEVHKAFGQFTDGKLDFPYVIKGIRLVKEGSELFKEAKSAAKLMISDYFELAHKLIYLMDKSAKINNNNAAQIVAGRAYLSVVRRAMKIMAVVKHYDEEHRGERHHGHSEGSHGPTQGPDGPNGPEGHGGPSNGPGGHGGPGKERGDHAIPSKGPGGHAGPSKATRGHGGPSKGPGGHGGPSKGSGGHEGPSKGPGGHAGPRKATGGHGGPSKGPGGHGGPSKGPGGHGGLGKGPAGHGGPSKGPGGYGGPIKALHFEDLMVEDAIREANDKADDFYDWSEK